MRVTQCLTQRVAESVEKSVEQGFSERFGAERQQWIFGSAIELRP